MEIWVFAGITNTTIRYRVNFVCAIRSRVTLCFGPHIAKDAFSLNQHIVITLSYYYILPYSTWSICCSLAEVNFQRKVPTICHTKVSTLTAGVMKAT